MSIQQTWPCRHTVLRSSRQCHMSGPVLPPHSLAKLTSVSCVRTGAATTQSCEAGIGVMSGPVLPPQSCEAHIGVMSGPVLPPHSLVKLAFVSCQDQCCHHTVLLGSHRCHVRTGAATTQSCEARISVIYQDQCCHKAKT